MRLLQPVDGSRDCLHAGLELEREELRIPALGNQSRLQFCRLA